MKKVRLIVLFCLMFPGCGGQKSTPVPNTERNAVIQTAPAVHRVPPAPAPTIKFKLGKTPLIGKTMDQIIALLGPPEKTEALAGEVTVGVMSPTWVYSYPTPRDLLRISFDDSKTGFGVRLRGRQDFTDALDSGVLIKDVIHPNLLSRKPQLREGSWSDPMRFTMTWQIGDIGYKIAGESVVRPYSETKTLSRKTGLYESTYKWTLDDWKDAKLLGYKEKKLTSGWMSC